MDCVAVSRGMDVKGKGVESQIPRGNKGCYSWTLDVVTVQISTISDSWNDEWL